MEIKQIKDLMTAMGRTGTKKMAIKKDGFELTLERGDDSIRYLGAHLDSVEENPMRDDIELHRAQAFLRGTHKLSPTSPSMPSLTEPAKGPVVDESKGVYITSPMVGTFYAATAPEDPPYLKVGDAVEKHTVVCIVEAMKVMNEVKAGVAGTVAEVLVENGQPIEFGSKLFRVIPQ